MENIKNWKESYPPYNSVAGWELEKQLAYNKLAYEFKDKKAQAEVEQCEEMMNISLLLFDKEMFDRYHIEALRLIEYRMELLRTYYNGLD